MRNFLRNLVASIFAIIILEIIGIIVTMNTKYNLIDDWYIPVVACIISCIVETYFDNKK